MRVRLAGPGIRKTGFCTCPNLVNEQAQAQEMNRVQGRSSPAAHHFRKPEKKQVPAWRMSGTKQPG
jgi:hypothetical protein